MVDNKRIVADFHAYRPFALMTCRLHEAGLLDGSRLSGARVCLKVFSAGSGAVTKAADNLAKSLGA